MNVLIVDPSKIIGMSCVSLLREMQVSARYVGTGHEAIDALDESHYGVCFLNPLLTGNNGIELLYEIASYEDLAGLRVVLMADDPAVYERYQHVLAGLHVVAVIKRTDMSKQLIERTLSELSV